MRRKTAERDALIRSIFAAIMLVSVGLEVAAQAPRSMTDPLFGVSYNPEEVHFEHMPLILAEKCPKLRGRYVEAWVYGHFRASDSEYFLISGLMEFEEDKPGGARSIAPEEGDGLIVALQHSKCLVDQAGYFYDQKINPAKTATPITAPGSVVSGILQDAFRRDVVAFGGKQELMKHVKPNVLLPAARREFEKFQKDPNGG
jgi:hypothetical protein